jgi:hypothetical protein
MALWFRKKDKNPSEVSAPVAKTQQAPPKIQAPPSSGPFPPVKPPQPTGLMPASAIGAGAATTQPMTMPRTGASSPKPPPPGQPPTRATQRVVLPTPPGSRPNSTKPLAGTNPGGRVNLPIGMILRCLPPEILAADLSEFETTGAAAKEISLPMNMILGQLPSGKVEMTLQDLVPHFPAGYLQPTETIAGYMHNVVSLPLMDVVMRIPPDLLALRPDQKDVDASVINMADPFTEEILREQAETARRQSQTNIIEESQAPQEEFVPRDQVPTVKSIAPPRRPAAEPLVPPRNPAATTLAVPAPPMPTAPRLPTPGPTTVARGINLQAPSVPVPSSRGVSASGEIAVPIRSTMSVPSRPQGPVTLQIDAPPPQSAAPVPPVPRHTGSIPAPPPPRHTTSLATPSRPAPLAGALPGPAAAPSTPSAPEKPPAAGPDDLQRLAALAMAQLGDSTESSGESASQGEFRPPAPMPPAIPDEPVQISQPDAVAPSETAPEPSSSVPMEPSPSGQDAEAGSSTPSVAFNLNTCTAEDLVQSIPGFSRALADSIIEHRTKIGAYGRLEELLDVPGMTKAAYRDLTGEAPPSNRFPLSLNELLGFPAEQHLSLKDVTERIACWPDVTGCILSQSSGLSLVGTVPEGVDKAAIVAFAPRMFESINKSFLEVSGQETDALVIPSTPSFHLFRNRDLYLIIMSRLPQMPERHVKVARFVLAALSARRD